MDIQVRELTEYDRPAVVALIATDHLRPEGILVDGTRYWGAFAQDRLVGVIGCEYENRYGLLRSALVDKAHRKMGIGEQLTSALLQAARVEGMEAVYLFSTGAGGYWSRLGFRPVPVAEVVARLPNAPQVRLFDQLGWLPTEAAFELRLGSTM